MRLNDQHVDRIIGGVLRAGMLAAVSVVLVGGVWYLALFGHGIPEFGTFRGEPHELRSVGSLLGEVLRGQPQSLIQLGLLMLIATPIARVAFSVFAFGIQRDRLYVGITLLVFAVLLASLTGYLSH